MRMGQSIAEFEQAFYEKAEEERDRRERLRGQAAARSRARRQRKVHRDGTLRFVGLVLAIVATSVIITLVMFQTLALLIGG